MPIAQFFRKKGYKEVEAVWLLEVHPSWFSISRQKGFQAGLDDPAVQEVCKIKLWTPIRCLRTTTPRPSPRRRCSSIRACICSSCWRISMSAPPRRFAAPADATSGSPLRIWMRERPTRLLHGGWPVMITYSPPISGAGLADANVMGKILLGKKPPLFITSQGTVTTPENAKKAYAKDWGGTAIPFK